MHDRRAVALQGCIGKQLAHHPPARFVGFSIAVGKRAASQQSAHTLGPPPLHGISLTEQIANRRIATNEDQALAEQRGFKDIAMGREAFLGKGRITKKSQGFAKAGDGPGAGKGTGHRCGESCGWILRDLEMIPSFWRQRLPPRAAGVMVKAAAWM